MTAGGEPEERGLVDPDKRLVRSAISTPRLELAPLRVADASEMVDVLANHHLYDVIGGEPPTLEDLTTRFEYQAAGRSPDGREAWHNWILRRRPEGAAIGFAQATVFRSGRAEMAWVVAVPWQGRGYATEAARAVVDWLIAGGATTITAHVANGHGASERVAEQAGLTLTDEVEDGERIWRLDVVRTATRS